MALELAVAVAAIAAKTIVAQVIQGAPLTRADYADVAGQVIDAIVTTTSQQQSQLQGLSERIEQVSQKIDEIPAREYDYRMAAGRRYLRDLPASWRTDQDRRQLIHTARDQFVQAAGIAEVNKDVRRQALAEVAIAGCWLWVPSINDLKIAAGNARKLLELEIVFGTASRTADDPLAGDYLDVLKLCKAYGERSPQTRTPAFGNSRARLTVRTVPDGWVECADIWVHVTRSKHAAADTSGRDLTVTVSNHRASSVSVGFPQMALVDVNLAGTAVPQGMPGSIMATRAAFEAHGRSSLAPGTKSAWRVSQPSAPTATGLGARLSGYSMHGALGRIEFLP